MDDIVAYLTAERERHLAELREFLAIPSVSTAPGNARDVRRAADWVVAQLRQMDLQQVDVHATEGGHPIVTARTETDARKPTALVYGHYDVQPAEPLDLWETPPFAPSIRDGKIYARGAADDKGQLFIHLKVLEAYRRVRGAAPINVKLLLEGEEEVGSPHLAPFLRRHAEQLACDVVIVSDTHMQGLDAPSITVGLRGLACVMVSVRTAGKDLHSGVYGGAVANPIQVLAELLVACKDPTTGRVRIPGFYDDVRRVSAAVQEQLDAAEIDDAAYARAIGASALFGELGFTTRERAGARPTFEVNGIWGGYTGEGMKTVLPCEAHAKISMRLVADQDPSAITRAFARYLESVAPAHASVTVTELRDAALPTLVDPDFPEMRHAARAVREEFGKAPAYLLEGGSIPIVAEFARILGRRSILLGFGLPDDNLHAPNEKFDLQMFDRGLRTVARFYHLWGTAS